MYSFNIPYTLAYINRSLPDSFHAHVQAMWNYGAYASDPALCLPLNGDSDLCGHGFNAQATSYFNRSDWLFIQTHGASGTLFLPMLSTLFLSNHMYSALILS